MIDRSAVVGALALAYPVAYVLFLGERYCGPACVDGTARGAAAATVVLLAAGGLGGLVVRAAARSVGDRGPDLPWWLADPSPRATVGVVALFAAYLAVLVLATTLPGGVPVPAVVASTVVYPVVWLLYSGTFALAIPFGIAGVEPGTATTLVVRTVVLVGGFGGSLAWQLLVATAVEDALGRNVASDPSRD